MVQDTIGSYQRQTQSPGLIAHSLQLYHIGWPAVQLRQRVTAVAEEIAVLL
jgi:hypothetical protein